MKDRINESFERFLESKAVAVEFRSEGTFTVRQDSALEKLAKFSFENKTDWVLKVVQAAVVAGAQILNFKLGRSTVEATFFLSEEISLAQISNTLLDVTKEQSSFAAELNVALRALLRTNAFQLVTSQGEALHWDGESLSEYSPPARPGGAKLSLMVRRNAQQSALLSGSLSRAYDSIQLARTLRRRAVYAPLTLLVDGQVLSPESLPLKHRMSAFKGKEQRQLLRASLAEDEVWDEELSSTRLASHGLRGDRLQSVEPFMQIVSLGRRGTHLELFCGFNEVELYGYTWDYRELRARKQVAQSLDLHFTRHGVVCATKTLPSTGLGGVLVAEGASCRGDLMGLRLEVDPADWAGLEHRLTKTVPLLRRLAAEIRAHRPMMDVPSLGKGLAKTLGLGAAGAKTLAFLVPASVPMLALGAWMGAGFGVLAGTLNVLEDSPKQVHQIAGWVDAFRRGLGGQGGASVLVAES